MPRYYGIAQKGGKTYQGWVEFDSPVEVIVDAFHKKGYAVDFYANINESSEVVYVELGTKEEDNHGKTTIN